MPADLYVRQQELNLSTPPDLTIVGCGGIGSWAAIFAAMSGIPVLYLFDPDVVENSNRNRLPFCEGALNEPKVEVIANFIRAIRPEALVFAMQNRFDKLLLDVQIRLGLSAVLDCTDSPRTQILLYNECKKYDIRYIRAGYDGTRIMVTSNVSGWIKVDSDEEPYEVNPSWVVPAATVAALAIGKLMKYFEQEVGLDLNEIGIPALQRMKRKTARCDQDGQSAEGGS